MRFDSAFYSKPGGRPTNEDSLTVIRDGARLLALAADGLGGMGGGDIASKDAVTYLAGSLAGKTVDEDLLCDEIRQENSRICRMHRDGSRMMTTIAALWTDGRQTLAANVGDTRIYQFRCGEIVFQSVDHSAAQLSVFSGKITQAQLRGYPGRNRLTRALGAEQEVWAELDELEVRPGDRLLLCTDGFWELVMEAEMLCWEADDSASAWLERMETLALTRCGPRGDNHSAIAVIVTEESGNAERC